MKRKIIHIDDVKCNGCGLCIPNCPEGAIQLIDGKARLISDLFCDGLGACLGLCPEEAITIEKREAGPYDEKKVMENIIRQGPNTVKAHLIHLKEHGEQDFLKTALEVLMEKKISVDLHGITDVHDPRQSHAGECPGSAQVRLRKDRPETKIESGDIPSELTHWPVQLHLISPAASVYQGADMVLAADCAAYAAGDFHGKFLKGRALAIACPKLDEGQDSYAAKLTALIDQTGINTLTVVIMEVPCCGGLLRLAQQAAASASRKIPVKAVVLGRNGQIMREEWT
jgi:ferredoxin